MPRTSTRLIPPIITRDLRTVRNSESVQKLDRYVYTWDHLSATYNRFFSLAPNGPKSGSKSGPKSGPCLPILGEL